MPQTLQELFITLARICANVFFLYTDNEKVYRLATQLLARSVKAAIYEGELNQQFVQKVVFLFHRVQKNTF